MSKTMTTGALKEKWPILKNGRANNFSIKRGGVTKNEIQLRFAGIIERKKNAPVVRNTTLWGVPGREPTRRGQNGQAAKDQRPSKLRHEIIRGRRLIFQIPFHWDPV